MEPGELVTQRRAPHCPRSQFNQSPVVLLGKAFVVHPITLLCNGSRCASRNERLKSSVNIRLTALNNFFWIFLDFPLN